MRDLSVMISKNVKKRGKCSNSHLYVINVKKRLDNNAQLELKITQFYVFQGNKGKLTFIKRPKSRKNA